MSIDVSFIMTVKNAEYFIVETIESILNQTIENWEFIIVDDGSQDNTITLVEEMFHKDNRLHLVKTKGIGRGHALNLAIQVSQGEFIANIDSDDPSHPQRAEIQMGILKENKQYSLMATNSLLIDEADKKILWKEYNLSNEEIMIKDITTSKEEPFRKKPINHSSVMFRREAIFEVGQYDAKRKMQYDAELWNRFTFKGHKLGLIQLNLASKRIHPNQSFESRDRKIYLKSALELNKIKVKEFKLPLKYYFYCYIKYLYGFVPPKLRKKVRRIM